MKDSLLYAILMQPAKLQDLELAIQIHHQLKISVHNLDQYESV